MRVVFKCTPVYRRGGFPGVGKMLPRVLSGAYMCFFEGGCRCVSQGVVLICRRGGTMLAFVSSSAHVCLFT